MTKKKKTKKEFPGSHWNYRVLAHEYTSPGEKRKRVHFKVHEVYYDENGMPNWYTQDAIEIEGESLPDLIVTLEMILEDVKMSSRSYIRDYGYGNKVYFAGEKFPQEYKVR